MQLKEELRKMCSKIIFGAIEKSIKIKVFKSHAINIGCAFIIGERCSSKISTALQSARQCYANATCGYAAHPLAVGKVVCSTLSTKLRHKK